MLQKMGWKSGDGLGRDSDGITTPITVCKRDGGGGSGAKRGLGSGGVNVPMSDHDDAKMRKLAKTKERYENCK